MKTLEELRKEAEDLFFSKMQAPCSPLADLASRLLSEPDGLMQLKS